MPLSQVEATELLTAPGQLFETADALIDGLRTKVWRNCPPSLLSVLELSRAYGERTFLVLGARRVSFAEHFAAAAAFAHVLRDKFSIVPGDRVAIAMQNLPEWVVTFFGALAAGAIAVPLNAWWTGAELAYALDDCGARVAVTDGERQARLVSHLATLGRLEHVVSVGPVASSGPPSDSLDSLIGPIEAQDLNRALPDLEIEPDDSATIFYTSGTTGRPKGVLGSHRNMCSNLMAIGFLRARADLTTEQGSAPEPNSSQPQSSLVAVPLFHAAGCHSVLIANTAIGGKLVMMERFDPQGALQLIEREQVTVFSAVPAIMWEVFSAPGFEKWDTSSLQSVAYGGAHAPPELLRRIHNLLPAVGAGNAYGLTETSCLTSLNSGVDYERKPDSVGRPLPVCEVRIVDPAGRERPAGQVGELLVKGPNVVRGYWNDPTCRAFSAGWFRTGDLARLDDEGFIYIVDRAKDIVVRGGENVSSAEVEAALYEHPSVAEAAVIGVPHPVLGEEVGAIVVLRPGERLSLHELREQLAGRLASFKIPSKLFVRQEQLPRNASGKVTKRQLREQLLGQ